MRDATESLIGARDYSAARGRIISFAWADEHLTDREMEELTWTNLALDGAIQGWLTVEHRLLLQAWLSGQRLGRDDDGQLVAE